MSKVRKVLLPIRHQTLWNHYKNAVDSFWKVEEVDLSQDLRDWRNRLTYNERHFLKHILAFFAVADSIVNINLIEYVRDAVPELEARYFYDQQILIEDVHTEMYNMLIFEYITDEDERDKLLNAFERVPCVRQKAQWAMKWVDEPWWRNYITHPTKRAWANISNTIRERVSDKLAAPFSAPSKLAQRMVAFAIVEGIFFSGSFAAIFYIKTKGIMPGLTFSNELISRDEGLHCLFACEYYNNHIEEKHKLSETTVLAMVKEAVEIEKNFFTNAIPVALLGMNSHLMCSYIEFVADWLLTNLKYSKYYYTPNPFHFMNMISLEGKTNFFERRVGEYKRFGAGQNEFNILEDF
ncbi:Ribonucleotide reductase 2a [Perigonia lusca single nucleopolyhedrovirus]|uniref:ribonucleoside-diphosphate reductase n=1 Tax=Perigonia lusca single nucleopolyhedrovirus TaxID=1675865 RepID=A0A0M3WP26_9ABAC|nr:Ribonucleotide reductase 2a [Perigonia lusca single nucleopolyhedrovirus]AKN80678.1 Ribonucleotide reductase 2a [Perigonia lusca single nucleopolyhedrovirus]